jgi:hypothetical protein
LRAPRGRRCNGSTDARPSPLTRNANRPPEIYAIRCAASGEIWVGQTLDLDKVWNRTDFTLRGAANPHRVLQAAWKAHGAGAFSFEALERLEDEPLEFARQSQLNERTAVWRAKLGAERI